MAGRFRPMIAAPTLEQLDWARAQYKRIEPRDLFYRAATDLLGRAGKADSVLNFAEALAVLLYSWNSAYYRYNPPDQEHILGIEGLLAANEPSIAALHDRRLATLNSADEARIETLFAAFEGLLGPVGAAKSLHLLAAGFFPIWDRRIAARYVGTLQIRGTNTPRYLRFMTNTAAQCGELDGQSGAPKDPVKALDEYNYVRFTRQAVWPWD